MSHDEGDHYRRMLAREIVQQVANTQSGPPPEYENCLFEIEPAELEEIIVTVLWEFGVTLVKV